MYRLTRAARTCTLTWRFLMCVCDFSCPFLLGWGQRDGMLAGFLLKVYGLVVVVAVVARWCWYWDGWWWVEVVGGGWWMGGGWWC